MSLRPCVGFTVHSGNNSSTISWFAGITMPNKLGDTEVTLQIEGINRDFSRLALDILQKLNSDTAIGGSVSFGLGKSWGEKGFSTGMQGSDPLPFKVAWNHTLS